MSDTLTGMLVLTAVSVVCAVFTHWRIRRYVLASLLSAVAAALIFQLLAAVQLGYLDPFALVALVMSLSVTGTISLLVGLPFLASRRSVSQSGP